MDKYLEEFDNDELDDEDEIYSEFWGDFFVVEFQQERLKR